LAKREERNADGDIIVAGIRGDIIVAGIREQRSRRE
jgi:hypothetical protein